MARIDVEALRRLIADATASVDALNFDVQKEKMVEPLGWARELVDVMEADYKKYLSLTLAARKLDASVTFVPNRLIDEFWHLHMLDSEKYHVDCDNVFGGYLHHFPYFGLQGPEDARAWDDASQESDRLWREIYGLPLFGNGEGDAYERDKEFYGSWSAAELARRGGVGILGPNRPGCRPTRCP